MTVLFQPILALLIITFSSCRNTPQPPPPPSPRIDASVTDKSVVKMMTYITILSRPCWAGGHESQAAINRKLYTICHWTVMDIHRTINRTPTLLRSYRTSLMPDAYAECLLECSYSIVVCTHILCINIEKKNYCWHAFDTSHLLQNLSFSVINIWISISNSNIWQCQCKLESWITQSQHEKSWQIH